MIGFSGGSPLAHKQAFSWSSMKHLNEEGYSQGIRNQVDRPGPSHPGRL